MTRLQILELPEGSGDDRPPFLLVVDQAADDVAASLDAPDGSLREGLAEEIGARSILVFRESVEIPANGPVAEAVSEVSESDFTEMATAVRRALGIDMTEAGVEPDIAGWLLAACRELEKSEAARRHLRDERVEARQWARHGYEIGQKHCGWSDHGVAPDWLTEGWPPHFDSCGHLKQAAEYDTALTRVLEVAADLEAAEAHGGAWDANQQAARYIRAAVGRPRDEKASGS